MAMAAPKNVPGLRQGEQREEEEEHFQRRNDNVNNEVFRWLSLAVMAAIGSAAAIVLSFKPSSLLVSPIYVASGSILIIRWLFLGVFERWKKESHRLRPTLRQPRSRCNARRTPLRLGTTSAGATLSPHHRHLLLVFMVLCGGGGTTGWIHPLTLHPPRLSIASSSNRESIVVSFRRRPSLSLVVMRHQQQRRRYAKPSADDDFDDAGSSVSELEVLNNKELVGGPSNVDEIDEATLLELEEGQPPEWMVMKDLLGINIFTVILAGLIIFFLSMNTILGVGWLGKVVGIPGTGSFEEVSPSLPGTFDLNRPEFRL